MLWGLRPNHWVAVLEGTLFSLTSPSPSLLLPFPQSSHTFLFFLSYHFKKQEQGN